jgi:Family of unknown function (DUF6264)
VTDMFVENTPEGRPPRSWDFFLTIFFIFVLLVLTVIFVFSALGFGVATLTCADSSAECNYEFISYGSLLVLFGVPIVTLAGVVMSVVWIARRKLSFWIPLVACGAAIGVFMLGSFLVSSAVPGA